MNPELCAPFQSSAARDNDWLHKAFIILGIASFHFRQLGRFGVFHFLKGWPRRVALWATMAPILRWLLFGIPVLDHFLLEYVKGGAYHYLIDVFYVIFIGTGFFIDFLTGINDYMLNFAKKLIDLLCDPFLPQRMGGIVQVRKRRHAQRGRLKPSAFSFVGCCLLGVCCGAEYTHVQHFCTPFESAPVKASGHPFDYGPLFADGKNCSIGEPYRPPYFPDLTDELSAEEGTEVAEAVVLLMNTRDTLQQLAALQEQAAQSAWVGAYNLIMFGHFDRPLERRDAPIQNFDEGTIQAAVRATWPEYGGHFELYNVEPQPDPLSNEGWVTIVFIRGHLRAHQPGQSFVLKEITTYRHTWAFDMTLPEHEAYFLPQRAFFPQLINAAGLQERCDTSRHGSCTILTRNNVVLRGTQVAIRTGDLVKFLVDEALPDPVDIVILHDAEVFRQNYDQALNAFPPRQFLSVHTHGYHGGFLGSRVYAAYRHTLLDFETFARQLTAQWQEEVFRNIVVHCVLPQPARAESTGGIEMHYLLNFGIITQHLVLLRHDHGDAPSDYAVVQTHEDMATPHHLLGLAGWDAILRRGLPDIFWGTSALAIDDLLQMRTGMLIAFSETLEQSADDLVTEDTDMPSLFQLPWGASDHSHGRTVGANGFIHLGPPGNGVRVTFEPLVWVVDNEEIEVYEQIVGNPFLEDLCDELYDDIDVTPNIFQADLRFWLNKYEMEGDTKNTFERAHWKQLRSNAFRNPFAKACTSSSTMDCDKGVSFPGGPHAEECLDTMDAFPEQASIPLVQHVPISISGDVESQFQPPRQLLEPVEGGIDFSKIVDTLAWIDAHVTLPSYVDPPEVDWHDSSQQWLALDWWVDEPICEMHFYTDGSQRSVGCGLASALFVKTQEGNWLYGGYKAMKLKQSGSYAAELSALLVTFKWIYDIGRLSCPLPDVVDVHFDSTSAGFRSTGHWEGHTFSCTVTSLRSLAHLIEERLGCSIRGSHVRAHCGDPGNEIANSLAYWAAGHAVEELDGCLHSCCEGCHDRALEWLFFLFKQELVPFWSCGHLFLPAQPLTEPSLDPLFDTMPRLEAPEQRECHVNFKITSANVLTLLPGSETMAGLLDTARQETILRQAKEAEILILSLQETRLRKSTFRTTKDFWIVQAAAERGHGGTLLAFSRTRPYGRTDHQPKELFFKKEHFSILHSGPRLLIVRVKAPGLRCLCACLHAPQSGQPDPHIRAWWKHLRDVIPERYRAWPLFAAGDFNARVGDAPTAATGGHQGEMENLNGELFQDWMISQALWAPSTWEQCQRGPSGTWQHSSGKWSRFDYICLPAAVRCDCAWVDLALDLALKRTDHLAVSAEVSFCSHLPGTSIFFRGVRDQRNASLPEHLYELPSLRPRIHPGVDVHTHTQELTAQIFEFCRPHRDLCSHQPQKHAMSSSTWSLVLSKKKTRNDLFWWQSNSRWTKLRTIFAAWKGNFADEFAVQAEVKLHDVQVAWHWHSFRTLGRRVTAATRQDTKDFFEKMAQVAGDLDDGRFSQAFWREIRKHFPAMRKRRVGYAPLQIEELEGHWIPHFAKLESGNAVEPQVLLDQCCARQREAASHNVAIKKPSELPSILEVEKALRATRPHKAAGPEGLDPGYLHWGAPRLSSAIHMLFVKIFTQCAEPLWFKGGSMVAVHKRASMHVVDNYRGIMLLPSISKCLQAILRARLVATLADIKPSGLIGGFAKQRVTFGSHSVQTFAAIADAYGLSSAVLYIDMKHAYHHLVRALSFGLGSFTKDFDETLASLPNDVMREGCRKAMGEECPIADAFVGQPILDLFREIHHDTFFLMQGQWVRTSRGSRPGSPMADMAFAGLMCKLHRRLDALLRDDPELQRATSTMGTDAYTLTWADDVTLELASVDAAQMVPLIQRISAAAFDLMAEHGLSLNLTPGKTSVVLTPRGSGAPALRKEWLLEKKCCPVETGNQSRGCSATTSQQIRSLGGDVYCCSLL